LWSELLSVLASLEGDGIGPGGGPEGNRRGVAHSEVWGRGDKSAPREGTLLFGEGERRIDRECYKRG